MVKIELYHCRFFKSDIDDYGKTYWCQNTDCPTRECWCNHGLENSMCPFFEKKKMKPIIVEYDKETVEYIRNQFITRIKEYCDAEYKVTKRQLESLTKLEKSLSYALEKLKERENCEN